MEQIASKIIKEQELIIGPLAWDRAEKVVGLHVVDKKSGVVSIDSGVDVRMVIDNLVKVYEHLFGRASHEVCREVARPFLINLTPAEIPMSLQ